MSVPGFVIVVILYLQFHSVVTTLIVFAGILVAGAGGFLMLWAYAQPWFLDAEVAGVNLRDLFSISSMNLSVAVWVGFLALFGIATDNGVIVCTYLQQVFTESWELELGGVDLHHPRAQVGPELEELDAPMPVVAIRAPRPGDGGSGTSTERTSSETCQTSAPKPVTTT